MLITSTFCREAEGELSLCAGDYLLVWTSGEPQGGYLDAELLDGRRGLVPASFVQRLVGELDCSRDGDGIGVKQFIMEFLSQATICWSSIRQCYRRCATLKTAPCSATQRRCLPCRRTTHCSHTRTRIWHV